MDDAVFFQILEEIEKILKQASWRGMDGIRGIRAEDIQLRDGPYDPGGNSEDTWKDEDLPAIFITPPNTIKRPSEAGTNTHDDIVYPVLCQLCDNGDDRFNRKRLRTHLRWMQDMARLFHGKDWTGLDFTGGCPVISWCQTTRVIDPEAYWTHKNFVRGTIVEVKSREPRTIT